MATPPSHKKWSAEHYRSVTCRLRVEEYEKLKRYAAEKDTNVSAIVLSYIREFIAEEDAKRQSEE